VTKHNWKVNISATTDLVGTAFLSLVYSLTIFLVVAVLARVLDESQFLEFSVVNRYLGFLAIAANLGIGFSFIKYSEGRGTDAIHALARLCRVYQFRAIACVAVLWTIFVLIWFRTEWYSVALVVLTYMWVVSKAQHHLTTPYTRRLNGFKGFVKISVLTKVFAPMAGLVAAVFTESYQIHFLTFGLVSFAIQFWFWRKNKQPIASATENPVLKFSRSRWVENIIRSALPVVFILAAQFKLGAHFAGSVAIIFTVAKSIESLLQPVVVAVMIRASSKTRKGSGLLASVGISLGLAPCVYLSRDWVFLFITTFLGDNYSYLQEEAWIVLMCSGAIISLSLLRGLNDNKLEHSPLVWINLACMATVPFVMAIADDLQQVAIGIVLIQALRYAAYAITIMKTLD